MARLQRLKQLYFEVYSPGLSGELDERSKAAIEQG
jgi:hypothetical protein